MGLFDFLSPLLTTATGAASEYQGAKANAAVQQWQRAVQQALMQRQLAKEDAETKHLGVEDTHLGNEDNPTVQRSLAGARGAGTVEGETPGLVSRERQMGPVKANNAGLTATAETPALVDRATQIDTATLPGKIKVAQARVSAQDASARVGQTLGNAWLRNNKALTDAVMPYAQAKTAFQQAKAGNPAALKSALIAYASVADPKAQLRQGVMNYVTQVDPSFRGTFEMAVDRLASGKLPPQVIDNMEKMVDQLHQTHAAMYEQRRNAYVSRVPQADAYIPQTQDIFQVPGISSGSGPASSAPDHILSKYPQLTPPGAKP